MKNAGYFLWLLVFCLICFQASAQDGLPYQTPPPAIAQLANAPQTPRVSVNGTNEWMLLMEQPGYPSIEELAQPELRLAGLRINPRTNGSSRSWSYNGLSFKNINTGKDYPVTGLPSEPQIENISWSPDGKQIAFSITRPKGLELWTANVDSRKAKKLTEARLNDITRGIPYTWMPDNQTILAKLTVKERGDAPTETLAPQGPVIQQTTGEKAAVRTYQDLLENAYDEALFEYYANSQLVQINVADGTQQKFGEAGIISSFSASPDGKYVLVGTIHRPFSYLVPYYRFPLTYDMMDTNGQTVVRIADIPLSENVPQGFGAVRLGPRSFTWRNDAPATLYWVEAQDKGDPSVETEVRDKLFFLEAPFAGEPQPGIDFALRYGGISWGNDGLAISREWWWTSRREITSLFQPEQENSRRVLYDRSFEDRYNDPGDFVTTQNEFGQSVLLMENDGQTLYLTGSGASSEGNRPFLRAFDLSNQQTKELWRSEAPYYEYPIRVLDPKKGTLITRRESKEMPPNYYLYNWKKDQHTALTPFEHPYPALKGIEKQVVQYKREDGVDLQGDLYLPKGYNAEKDGPLPVLVWAYPNEYKSAQAASQVEGSPYEFIRLYWGSPLYWLTQGYAVFDDISMPIIGEGEEEPNDNFREQLVANAKAGIDKLADMGVADRSRVAIGGHSYGAFMTANLLAHSDLFAAGIARSGAYNRTLTPFGFQSEERTYWQAPEVYYTMSPFMHADKVNEPILLIHGEADNNSGTFPIQSERYYAAIKGLGGTARLVMLPYESHGYRAQESILHMLWEQDQWLEKHVKNKKEVKP